MNKQFLINLNDFQNKAVETLLEHKGKVIVKSQKFTGKTMIASKLFERADSEMVLYHTGCCPELFIKAKEEFLKIIKDNRKETTIILDEFYDEEIMNYISDKDNISCYVLTNDLSLNKEGYKSFNYYNSYKKFINNEKGEYLNIHQVLNKDINFDKKNEKLRRSSVSTTIFIKENNSIKEYKMELEK